MTRPWLVAVAIVAGTACSGGLDMAGDDTTPDAPTGCAVALAFDPAMALAGPETEIRASALVSGASGVLTYTWEVTRGGSTVAFAPALPDQSAIAFAAPDPGPYRVMVAVSAAGGAFCPTAQGDVNVGVPGGNLAQVRLRVYPPASVAAPPAEKLVLVPGGAGFSLGNVTVEPGVVATGHVRAGTTGVPAYLRFIPLGARDAVIEAFAAADGSFSARVLNQVHDVLIVPSAPGYAPRRIAGWVPGTPLLAIDAGTAVTGTVLDPGGQPIANAHVQLAYDGVPSTLATTDGAGMFAVLAVPVAGAEVRVQITPPAASGWPRITGAAVGIASPLSIQYSAVLQRRDAGGAVVRRGGVAQANAPVTIVGTIGAVATINGNVSANGEVRIATRTTGAGAIPASTLAPAAPLSAVSQIGAQLAVGAFDLSAGVPASIDAPAAVSLDIALRDAAAAPLPGAVLELAPSGPLALAGAPALRAAADGAGTASLLVPAGGRFDVRASDPRGRAAPIVVTGVPTASLAAAYALAPALHVTGTLVLAGNPQPVGRATVQILCTQCTGVDRSRPLAEGATSAAGAFDVAVHDPGVN